MNENFVSDLLSNEEFKEKLSKVQSNKEYLELLKEYSIPIREKDELKIEDNSDFIELNDESLEKVSGGGNLFIDIDDWIYTAMKCENCDCGYVKRKKGYWVATCEKCPKCGQETLRGKQLIIPW